MATTIVIVINCKKMRFKMPKLTLKLYLQGQLEQKLRINVLQITTKVLATSKLKI